MIKRQNNQKISDKEIESENFRRQSKAKSDMATKPNCAEFDTGKGERHAK